MTPVRIVVVACFAWLFAGCGALVAECDARSCAGCCRADGTCALGFEQTACGAGGALCDSCVGAQLCTAGRCDAPKANTSPGSDAGVRGLQLTAHGTLHSSVFTARAGSSVTAGSTRAFVLVDLSMANGTSASVPLRASGFAVFTAGLEHAGSDGATGQHPEGCDPNALLAAGAQVRCTLVFELPRQSQPTELRRQGLDGGAWSTALVVRPCSTCGNECFDLAVDPAHCGSCDRAVGQGTCLDGEAICAGGASRCGNTCVDLRTDPNHCGSCTTSVREGQRCVAGEVVCEDAQAQVCGGACTSKRSNEHCGSCSINCSAIGGSCTSCTYLSCVACEVQSAVGTSSCAAVCGALQCIESMSWYRCSQSTRVGIRPSSPCGASPPTITDRGTVCSFENVECMCG